MGSARLFLAEIRFMSSAPIVIYWPSTEPSIKRCTCVNKQKNSGSRWMFNNNITRCPDGSSQLETRCPKWEPAADRGLWALSDPQLSNPSQDEEEVLQWSRGEHIGQYSSLSLSPTHLSHTTNITLWRIKCERDIYFYKEVCSFVYWSSYIMFDYVSAYICIPSIQYYDQTRLWD